MTNPNLTENEFTADLGLDQLAIQICGDCQKECEKHADKHAACKACAEACADCVKACKAHLHA
jgi:hypothetical protein